MSKIYNVGVIGAGRIAQNAHIGNIINNPRLRLKWVVDAMESQLTIIRDKFNLSAIPMYLPEELDNLLTNSELDAVLILTSVQSHADFAVRCLNAGKHVFVEKPVGQNLEEVTRCCDAAEKNDKILLPGFMRRNDPAYKKAYQDIADASIGDIRTIRITTHNSPFSSPQFYQRLGKEGGNIIQDSAIHDIDTLVWFTNRAQPETVIAQGHSHHPEITQGLHDTTTVQIKFRNGVLATSECLVGAFEYHYAIEVYGTKGKVTSNLDCLQVTTTTADPCHLKFANSYERLAEAFKQELDHFVECLDGTKPCITREDMLLTTLMLEKTIEAYKKEELLHFKK